MTPRLDVQALLLVIGEEAEGRRSGARVRQHAAVAAAGEQPQVAVGDALGSFAAEVLGVDPVAAPGDGATIATACADRTARVWGTAALLPVAPRMCPSYAAPRRAAQVSPATA
jgi:hypothetical protein